MKFCSENDHRSVMRCCALFFRGLLLCAALGLPATVLHAAPNIPPGLVEQAKRLSPAEQRALAAQYGIAVPTTAGTGMTATDEAPEVPLVQNRLEMTDSESRMFVEDLINAQKDALLPRFGSQLFSEDLEAYAPLDEALAPSGYLLGPGDELTIQVFGKDPIETLVQVDRGGQITVPKIGSISLAGLTFEEAKRVIAQRVNTRVIGSEVVTSLGSLRQISIFLAGEVNAPGNYNVSALTSTSQALYLSDGLTDIGSFRDIQVRRANQVVARFDLYDLLLRGKRDNDITLQSGDTVFVPVARGIISIDGAVKRPARYDLNVGETFAEAVAMAGGFTATAYQQLSTIRRFDTKKGFPSILTITDPKSDVVLQDGDFLIANEGTTQLANAIELKGALVRPGVYAFSEGARASDYLGSIDRDLLPNADLEIGLIVRRINARLDIEVLAFDLVAAAQSPGSALDPELQVFDQIIVLPIPNVKEADLNLAVENAGISGSDDAEVEADGVEQEVTRSKLIAPIVEKLRDQAGAGQSVALVSVQGAVKEPGEYPLIRAGGLSFLVQLAGGLEDGAYLKEVEVRRINASKDSASVEILNASLNSESTFALQSRDVVRINFLPDWNPDASVEILGEVRFPGLYALRDGETIGSLINRAGGFSSEAFPEATRFTSKATKDQQQASARKLIERFQREQASRRSVSQAGEGPAASTDADYTESLLASFQGRLVVDVPRILAGDASADVLLQDGDELIVPKLVESITVAGEVYEPGSFRFEQGLSFSDYLELAAGITDRARKKDIYVIEPNGAVVPLENSKRQLFRFDRSVAGLSPGSVIVVPTNYDYEKPLDRYRGITSVVFESLASVAAFFSIANK
ncbi:SLBB domain-containing protein [Pseudomonadales bacterium]|nr:SLBB domain-containing protein [Pseudomonadales bacterium]